MASNNLIIITLLFLLLALSSIVFYYNNQNKTKSRLYEVSNNNEDINSNKLYQKLTDNKIPKEEITREINLPIKSPNGNYTLTYIKDDLFTQPYLMYSYDVSGGGSGSGLEGRHIIKKGKLFEVPPSYFNPFIKLHEASNGVFSRVVLMNGDGIIVSSSPYYHTQSLSLSVNDNGQLVINSGNIAHIDPIIQ
jgi:hypothetical protein